MCFLNRMLVAEDVRPETNKLTLKKLKTYAQKEKFKHVKRNPKEWEKVFISYTFDREFMFSMDKDVKKISIKATNHLLK